jgi:hypothetical protein
VLVTVLNVPESPQRSIHEPPLGVRRITLLVEREEKPFVAVIVPLPVKVPVATILLTVNVLMG